MFLLRCYRVWERNRIELLSIFVLVHTCIIHILLNEKIELGIEETTQTRPCESLLTKFYVCFLYIQCYLIIYPTLLWIPPPKKKRKKRPFVAMQNSIDIDCPNSPKRCPRSSFYTRSITYGKSNASLASASLITLPPPEDAKLRA